MQYFSIDMNLYNYLICENEMHVWKDTWRMHATLRPRYAVYDYRRITSIAYNCEN